MAWIAKPTRFLKSPTTLKAVKSIVQCWLQAKVAENKGTYFFWNSTDNSCHLSNQNSEVCATSSEEKCSKEEDSMNELNEGSWTAQTKFCKSENYSYDCKGTQDIVAVKDPDYQCAKMNDNVCIFYKRKIYNIWDNALETPWVYVCVILCAIYVFVGIPFLVYLNQDKTSIVSKCEKLKKKSTKRFESTEITSVVAPTTFAIPKHEFGALFRVGLIPKRDEFHEINEMDTQLHVLKYSTGYGSRHPNLNRSDFFHNLWF